MRTLLALLTVRFLNLHFNAEQSWNFNMVTFKNSKGNTLYLTFYPENNTIEVLAYKVTARCYRKIIDNSDNDYHRDAVIEQIALDIKTKLKLIVDIKK